MFLIFMLWFFSVFIGTVVGWHKGQPIGGFFISCLFGPLGLVGVLLSADKNRVPCRYCKERIMKTAIVCPNCRKELSANYANGY